MSMLTPQAPGSSCDDSQAPSKLISVSHVSPDHARHEYQQQFLREMMLRATLPKVAEGLISRVAAVGHSLQRHQSAEMNPDATRPWLNRTVTPDSSPTISTSSMP